MKTMSVFILLLAFSSSVFAGTFSIENIHVHEQVDSLQEGIQVDNAFVPQVEVEVKVSQEAASEYLLAKAYYYDSAGKLLKRYDQPSVAQRIATDGAQTDTQAAAWPKTMPQDQSTAIYFPLPDKLPDGWTLIVVFGNTRGAVAASVPDNQTQSFNYPESNLVAKTLFSPDVEIAGGEERAPLIEQVVQSTSPNYPAFTMLMHLPHGVTDPKKVSGVLAYCIIANSVADIRDSLNAIKPRDDPNPYFAYAEDHNLAIVAWGARWLWSFPGNFDELSKDQIQSQDDDFAKLADAWDFGIQSWVDKYGIPDHDYLMYGLCIGGEWAHRLALRKPNRFLAVQTHISASYDAPTPEASHVLWLLTTGELDGGCDCTRRFYTAAKALKYPIIFKSIIGLGHEDSPLVDQLGIQFFDYALSIKGMRDAANANNFSAAQPLNLSAFDAPPFYGDLMNQGMFPAQEKDMIPSGFRVSLPTKQIADAWNN